MKRPTLAQLMKRPALWDCPEFNIIRITYPQDKILKTKSLNYNGEYFYVDKWKPSKCSLKQHIEFENLEFIGFL